MKRLLVSIVALAMSAIAFAQLQPMSPIPEDKDVRHGTLANGMTYYVRHCDKQKNLADFYILSDVGAIQEADDQQGLAHFLEHMAFNGTKNYPGKRLIEYLESVGVSFGRNLNAGTSWDTTTYLMTDVPTLREGVVDSALLILHDWSHFIAMEPKEIDSERGVIMEELRTRDGAQWRSVIEMIKATARGTKYENRNLIGYLDGLKSFDHQSIHNFYETWYRPDYQCIIVVGDIDADKICAKIESLMADIPAAPENAPKKEVIVVPDNEEPIITVFEDKEMTSSSAMIMFKRPALPKNMCNKVVAEMQDVVNELGSTMISNRMEEISIKPDAPFTYCGCGSGGLGICPTLDGTMFNVMTKDGGIKAGIEAVYREIARVARHGFTYGEFERAQNDILKDMETEYNNRNDRKNAQFVRRYLSAYSSNTPIPDAETEWKLDSMLVKNIPLDAVNAAYKQYLSDNNQVIFVSLPKKDGVTNPTAEEIAAVRAAVAKEEIAPYEDKTVKEPLIPEGTVLKGSKVKTVKQNAAMGITEWTLKNGVRILVKPTTFKADEVLVKALAHAGECSLTDEEFKTSAFMPTYMSQMGLGKFSSVELSKQLSGKNASVGIGTDAYELTVEGECSPKDMETMLQLVYLQFTSPRFDKSDFDAVSKKMHSYIDNMVQNPDYIANRRIAKNLYCGSPRHEVISPEMIDAISFEQMPAVYSKLFSSAKDFTFVIVGNVDVETLRPMVEKYIGSIPAGKSQLKRVDDGTKFATGNVTDEFRQKMEQPKVTVFRSYSGQMEYTLKNKTVMTFLYRILSDKYLKSIREEKGGTYGVGVYGTLNPDITPRYILQTKFDTNEQMADELSAIIVKEIEGIAQNGPKPEEMNKVSQFLLKDWKNVIERNGAWFGFIDAAYYRNIDMLAQYESTVSGVTADDVKAMAAKILADGNMTYVVMRPEKQETEPAK